MIFFCILVVIVGLFYYAITMPIKNIYIQGNHIVLDNEILTLSSLYEYPSFLLTKKSTIQKKILKNNYIKDVVVKKRLGNVLELLITEYQVIAFTRDGKVILSNGRKLDAVDELEDIPILMNEIDKENIYREFASKFGKLREDILKQISEIEYCPVSVDEERFLLYMNDGNLVYITLTKIEKLNLYNQMKDQLGDKRGIIYLDSGDYVEVKSG